MGYLRLQIEKSIPYLLMAVPVYLLVRWLVLRKRNTKADLWRELGLLAGFCYLVVLLRVTVIPNWGFYSTGDGEYAFYIGIGEPLPVNLIPFKTVWLYLRGDLPVNPGDVVMMSFANLAGNVLLLAPMGFLLPLLYDRMRSWKKNLLLGVTFSLTLEMVQYFLGRTADIDDVLLNSLGILLGYAAWRVVSFWQQKKKK